jgi:hypothetical protein
MTRVSYDTVNPTVVGTVDRPGGPLRRMAEVLANAMLGKLNVGGTVTLGTSPTTLIDSRIGVQSLLLFMATDTAGAGLLPSIYVSSRGKGQATINHTATSSVNVDYVVIG